MDYVDGKTLDLYDWHSFTQLKKYEICLKILQAVYNAHANDVIHRDLKPQNIIYDDVNDEITIIDFGSSKIKTIIEKETTMPMFSENYSAPEVVKGNDITEESINKAMKEASNQSFGYTDEELVSSDVIGMRYGSLFDSTQTMVTKIDEGLYQVQVVSWYDNENSYTSQMVRTIKYFAEIS